MESDVITVVYGQQKFAPVQYHSFDIGPFSMSTTPRPGETYEQAYERAYGFLESCAKNAYKSALAAFLLRVRDAAAGSGRR
jgi:hypothetical protein